ncbi:MAG: hypothetical protein ABI472_11205 [Ginsengibacter sp.]
MLRILFFFLIGILLISGSYGQTNPSDKQILDSLLENDEMLKMINGYDKASSYFRIDVGIGNKLYSNQNKAIQSLQNNSQLVINPSAGYYHKSGFGISVMGYLLNENKKTNFYQYAITPSFSYSHGKVADASFYYTHDFIKNVYSTNTSPVQDELNGNLAFKQPWIKPTIAAGYSSGKFYEIIKIDTTIRVLNRQVHINYTDTTTIKLSSFSFAASIEHSFIFYNLLSPKDGLSFTPQVSLITGINTYHTSHTSSLDNFNAFTKKRLKRIRNFQSQLDNNKFKAQSIGFDLNLNYSFGIFYVEPDFYFGYYLPNTTDNRFTQIYTLNIGITF